LLAEEICTDRGRLSLTRDNGGGEDDLAHSRRSIDQRHPQWVLTTDPP
jgi:hypothetical protein